MVNNPPPITAEDVAHAVECVAIRDALIVTNRYHRWFLAWLLRRFLRTL